MHFNVKTASTRELHFHIAEWKQKPWPESNCANNHWRKTLWISQRKDVNSDRKRNKHLQRSQKGSFTQTLQVTQCGPGLPAASWTRWQATLESYHRVYQRSASSPNRNGGRTGGGCRPRWARGRGYLLSWWAHTHTELRTCAWWPKCPGLSGRQPPHRTLPSTPWPARGVSMLFPFRAHLVFQGQINALKKLLSFGGKKYQERKPTNFTLSRGRKGIALMWFLQNFMHGEIWIQSKQPKTVPFRELVCIKIGKNSVTEWKVHWCQTTKAMIRGDTKNFSCICRKKASVSVLHGCRQTALFSLITSIRYVESQNSFSVLAPGRRDIPGPGWKARGSCSCTGSMQYHVIPTHSLISLLALRVRPLTRRDPHKTVSMSIKQHYSSLSLQKYLHECVVVIKLLQQQVPKWPPGLLRTPRSLASSPVSRPFCTCATQPHPCCTLYFFSWEFAFFANTPKCQDALLFGKEQNSNCEGVLASSPLSEYILVIAFKMHEKIGMHGCNRFTCKEHQLTKRETQVYREQSWIMQAACNYAPSTSAFIVASFLQVSLFSMPKKVCTILVRVSHPLSRQHACISRTWAMFELAAFPDRLTIWWG